MRSLDWRSFKTQAYRIRVDKDRRKRRLLNTATSAVQSRFKQRVRAHAPYGRLSSSNLIRVFMWTGKYDSNTLRMDAGFFKY